MKIKLSITLILIILTIFGLSQLTYAVENNVTLTSSTKTARVGDDVTITMNFSQKVQAADLKIKFSSEYLKFKSTLSSFTQDEDFTVRNGEIQYCIAKNTGVESIPITFEIIKAGNTSVTTDIENLNIDLTNKLDWINQTVNLTINEKATVIDVTSVALDKTTASLKVGETLKLTATVLPADATNKTVTWKSSNTSVATVSNGTVTGVKAGTTTITATAGTKSATCTITVTENDIGDPSEIEVTSIALDKTTASLKAGQTLKLTATVLPGNATNKTVTWKSSNTSVATVSNGTVTGVKAGTTTITATAGTKSATCTITVTEDEIDEPSKIEVTSIALDKKIIEFVKEGETLKLNATVLPANATDNTVVWESSDTSIATVSNGTVTGIKAGTATITATAGTKSVMCTVIVTKKDSEQSEKINITLTSSNQSVEVGDTVTVTIKTSQKIPIADFELKYTDNILQLESYVIDENEYTDNSNPIEIFYISLPSIDTFTFTFKAIAKGSATISTDIKNLYNGESLLDFENQSIIITATEKTTLDVTSIALDKTTASLKVGETLKLITTILPENATDKTVTWKSSDTSIATVSNGTVKALKKGTVTITASAGNKTAICKITITDKTNSSSTDKDNTTSTKPIPQTGETLTIIAIIIAIVGIAIVSIIKYRRYRDI